MLLGSSQLDAAIVSGIVNLSGYRCFPLTVLDNLFACKADSALSPLLSPDHPVLSLEELASFPIYVCSIGEEIEQTLRSMFQSRNISYNIAGTFLPYNGVIEAAVKDMGIILVNRINFEHTDNLLKEIQVEDVKMRSHLSLICSNENTNDPAIQSFIEFAQKNFESIRSRFPSYRNL